MNMEKEFGKFTENQIRDFINTIPSLFESRSLYHEELRNFPSKLHRLMPKLINWSWAYEMSMQEHIAAAAYAMALTDNIREMANSVDPQQAVLDDINTELPIDHQPNADIQTILQLTEGMACSIECLLIYGKYINEIIAEVRENIDGAEEWLFKAIRIDPNVVTCATAQDRLCRAILLEDKHFMNELHKALKGKTGSQAKYLNDFRFLMQLLHESDSEELTNNRIKELVFKLGIYTTQGDGHHNITELIRKYRKS